MSEIENGGLDQYMAKCKEYGIGGEGVKGGVLGVLHHPGPQYLGPPIGGRGKLNSSH